jgi:hypothetical protein
LKAFPCAGTAKTKMKLVAKKGAARAADPSPQVAQKIIASGQVGRVEALRYALTHPARSEEEQTRLLRETLRNVAPANARFRGQGGDVRRRRQQRGAMARHQFGLQEARATE